MQKVLFTLLVILMGIGAFCSLQAFAEELIQPNETERFSRIDFIKIHVKSCTVEFIHHPSEGESESIFFKAGTPTLKNTKGVPFGVVGVAYRIVLNPRYIPTKSHVASEKRKGKKPKMFYSPGDKDNPLGIMKLYFAFPGINPTLSFGMHTTNNPASVGHRVSEGCARISEKDARESFGIILQQNGIDEEALFQQMTDGPKSSIPIILRNKPKVVYLND